MKKVTIKVDRRMLRNALKSGIISERGIPPGGAAPSTGTSGPQAGQGRGSGKQTTDPFTAAGSEASSPGDKLWAALDADKADSDLSNIDGMRTSTGASTEYKNVEKLPEPISVVFEFYDWDAGAYPEVLITHRLQRGAGRWHALAETGSAKELMGAITDALDIGLTSGIAAIGALFTAANWEEIQEIYNVWLFLSKGKAPTKYSADLSGMKVVDAVSVNSQMKHWGLQGSRVFFFDEDSGSIVDAVGAIYDEYGGTTFDADIADVIDDYEAKPTQKLALAIQSLTKDIPEETSAWTTVQDWLDAGYGAVMGSDEPRAIKESFRQRRKRIKRQKLLKEAADYEDPEKFGTSYEGIGTDYVKYVTEDGRNPRARGSYRFLTGDQLLLWYNKTPSEQIVVDIQPQTGGREAGGQDALKNAVNQLITDWAGAGGGQTDLLPWDEMSIWIINANYRGKDDHPTRPNGLADPYRHPDFKDLLADRINANYERFRNEWATGAEEVEEPEETEESKCPDMKVKPNFSGNIKSNIEEVERLLDGYISFHKLTSSVDDDGTWNEDVPFLAVVKHASTNHPKFKKMKGVDWDSPTGLGRKWQANASSLGQPGYEDNLTGMIAFLADAYNCEIKYGLKKQSSGGGSGGGGAAAPKTDSGPKEEPKGCATKKRTWRDVKVNVEQGLEGRKRFKLDGTALEEYKKDLAELAVAALQGAPDYMGVLPDDDTGIFNLGVGGRLKVKRSHDWDVGGRVEDKIVKKGFKNLTKQAKKTDRGLTFLKGTVITIHMPCGDYRLSSQNESKKSDEQILVEMIRKMIRGA